MIGRTLSVRSVLRQSSACAPLCRVSVPARFVASKTAVLGRAAPATSVDHSFGSGPVPTPPTPQSSRAQVVESPLQRIHHETSGISVLVYPDTVALVSPRHGIHEPVHFDHVWLRDACLEPNSVQPDTKQKLFHTSDITIPGTQGLLLTK